MPWSFSLYLTPIFAAGVVAAGLAGYAWRRRDQRAARPFALLMAGLAVWSLAYGIELGFDTIGPMLFWDKASFVGAAAVPTAWFLLAAEFAGYDWWVRRRVVGLLAVEPTLVVALVWTNGAHGLIWRSASVDASGPFPVPEFVVGPAYWANLAYSYVLVVAGVAILVGVVVRASRVYRRQGAVLLVGTTLPLAANVVFNLVPSANPVPHLDLTPFAFVALGVFYALALFRYRLLELVPTARETLVDEMADGILVVDTDGRIADANPSARRALGEDVLGRPVAETAIGAAGDVRDGFVELPVDGGTRSFEVSRTALSDFRGGTMGQFVHLRDITELRVLRDQEQRLSVLNRVLRHNLRNELNVIAGRSNALVAALDGEQREQAQTITAAAERMLEIGEKARHVESTVGRGRADRMAVDAAAVAETVTEAAAEAHPEATISFDGPEAALAAAVGREQFAVAIENLVENAIEHNPNPRAEIDVSVSVRDGTIRIEVVDDGPGIPEIERSALARDRETPLRHGSGLGLWLVRWFVDASGGALTFSDRQPRGSVVAVELDAWQAADDPERPDDGESPPA